MDATKVTRRALLFFGASLVALLAPAILSLEAERRELQALLMARHIFQDDSQMARCLDGSPPAFYYRPSSTKASGDKWLIFLEGGGWCYDMEDCHQRSQTDYGSSYGYPSTFDVSGLTNYELLSGDEHLDPMMYDWNTVYVKYCDGSFYTSNVLEPVDYNGKKLYFRGKYIVHALLQHLKENWSLGTASEVVISGCSAGAIATALWIDQIADSLSPTTKVVALADSGFLPDFQAPDYCSYRDNMRSGFALMNNTWILPQECLDDFPGDRYKCTFFNAYVMPHRKTPIFTLQSTLDSWQRQKMICNTEDTAVQDQISQAVRDSVTFVQSRSICFGSVVDNTFRHCGGWSSVHGETGEVSQRVAFQQWYKDVERTPPTLGPPYEEASPMLVQAEVTSDGSQTPIPPKKAPARGGEVPAGKRSRHPG